MDTEKQNTDAGEGSAEHTPGPLHYKRSGIPPIEDHYAANNDQWIFKVHAGALSDQEQEANMRRLVRLWNRAEAASEMEGDEWQVEAAHYDGRRTTIPVTKGKPDGSGSYETIADVRVTDPDGGLPVAEARAELVASAPALKQERDRLNERVEELEEALGEMVEVFGDMADMVLHRRTQAKDKYPYKRAVSKAHTALASTESRKAEGSA